MEVFVVQLRNPSPGLSLGSLSQVLIGISPDEIVIKFNQTTYIVEEGEVVILTVVLIGDTITADTNINNFVSVDVVTVNDTAAGKNDSYITE